MGDITSANVAAAHTVYAQKCQSKCSCNYSNNAQLSGLSTVVTKGGSEAGTIFIPLLAFRHGRCRGADLLLDPSSSDNLWLFFPSLEVTKCLMTVWDFCIYCV